MLPLHEKENTKENLLWYHLCRIAAMMEKYIRLFKGTGIETDRIALLFHHWSGGIHVIYYPVLQQFRC